MRKQAKLLANFLGATKELTSEYIDIAGITPNELDQMRMGLLARERRKDVVKMLAANGLSTREIADLTGWGHSTIANDLRDEYIQGGGRQPLNVDVTYNSDSDDWDARANPPLTDNDDKRAFIAAKHKVRRRYES